MQETRYRNIHRQINNLIPIIELCLPFMDDIDLLQNKLNFLPNELEYLKRQAEYLKQKADSADSQTADSYHSQLDRDNVQQQFKIEDAEFELDFLVNHLEDILISLMVVRKQINNLVVLRERVEALQEERLDSITPERIYRLLEKQQLQNYSDSNERSHLKTNRFKKLWQKAVDYKYSRRITKSTAAIAGIILCFGIVSYSSIKYQNEHNTVETIDKTTEEVRENPTDI